VREKKNGFRAFSICDCSYLQSKLFHFFPVEWPFSPIPVISSEPLMATVLGCSLKTKSLTHRLSGDAAFYCK
jgi:hypothetical protein